MRDLVPQPIVYEVLNKFGELVEYQGGVSPVLFLLLLLVGLLCLLTDETTAPGTHLEDAFQLLEALCEEVLRLLP